jgi:hypothetical protein
MTDAPFWQWLWRCPYCQNIITNEVIIPELVTTHHMEEFEEFEGMFFTCPICKNQSYVPEE